MQVQCANSLLNLLLKSRIEIKYRLSGWIEKITSFFSSVKSRQKQQLGKKGKLTCVTPKCLFCKYSRTRLIWRPLGQMGKLANKARFANRSIRILLWNARLGPQGCLANKVGLSIIPSSIKRVRLYLICYSSCSSILLSSSHRYRFFKIPFFYFS